MARDQDQADPAQRHQASRLALRHLRTQPAMFVGLAWFVGTLVPVIGLVQVGMQASADRYAYIPHIGLFVLVVWGLYGFEKSIKWGREVLGTTFVLAVVACCYVTMGQVKVWQSDLTLFGHAKAVTERNYIAMTIYGKQLADLGKNEEALALYQQVIEIQPRYASGHYVLAEVYRNIGRTNDSLASYTEALRMDPYHVESLNSRGALLTNMNREEEAKKDFLKAIELMPSFDLSYLNLGIVLQHQGKLDEAVKMYAEYLKLEPKSVKALALLGDIEFRRSEFDQAIKYYEEALKYEPKRTSCDADHQHEIAFDPRHRCRVKNGRRPSTGA